jgi:outer membrane protein, multidrug efflux system
MHNHPKSSFPRKRESRNGAGRPQSQNWMPAFAGMTVILLSACALGPDHVRPADPEIEGFSQTAAIYRSAAPEAEFWRGFGDARLAALVEGALAANHDLRAGLARLQQARALARLSRRDLLPTVTAGAAHSATRASADQAPGLPREARDAELFGSSIDMTWELDLFGRVRRASEATRAEAQAVAADLGGLQVSVAAEVARSYFELRGLQTQLRVARGNAGNLAETLRLTEVRLEAGSGTEFDVARARAQLELTRSRIPLLEAALQAAAHRLAVLNGREPSALMAELDTPQDLPALPESIAIGTPAELLRRRPDIAAAERRLAAATARIGVAAADLFPRLSFNGSVGSAATSLGDLFTRDAQTYGFGPALHWAFLDLGRVRDRIAASDAAADAQLAQYEGTVLRALEETENALVGYLKTWREGQHLAEAAAASQNAARLARLRFEGGAADFLQVLDAERSRLDAEDRLAQSRTRTATQLVAVYKAVAGGWPERLAERLPTVSSADRHSQRAEADVSMY